MSPDNLPASSPRKIAGRFKAGPLQNWLLGLLLVVAVILVYQPVWHAGFIWDDDAYVTDNPLLIAPDGLWRIWFSLDSPSQYFPLTYTVFRLEHAFWGLNATGYHWINILLHASNALLVWWLLRRLAVPGAWLAAAIWALHPVQVETVAWITELKNILMCFCYMLTLHAWLGFVDGLSQRKWILYAIALVLYVLALSAKTTACTLPAALFLILWWQHRPITKARLAQVIPFLVLGVGMGLVSMWWERFHQGTQGKTFSLGVLDRLLLAGHALWFYAGKLLWPANLMFSYPRWTINPADPLAYGWLLACAAAAMGVFYFRRVAGRGPEVALLFYALTLSPLLGFIMLYTFRYTFVADHYQYVACLGPLVLGSAGIVAGLDRIKHRRSWMVKPVICAALPLTLGALTWHQAGIYQNPETLWRDTLVKNPDSSLANSSLGGLFIRRGLFDVATGYCARAIQLNPDSYEALNNLGIALAARGQAAEAIPLYRRAIQIQPNFPEVFNNLGVALAANGQPEAAIASYRRAIQCKPDYIEAMVNLGVVLSAQGRLAEALESIDEAIRINPNLPDVFFHRGLTLYQMGHTSDAVEAYQTCLKLNPEMPEALNNLAWLLATSPDDRFRNGVEAVHLAGRACELTQDQQPFFIGTLAAAYAEAGRFDEATATAKTAGNLAQSFGKPALALKMQKLMEQFQARHAYREDLKTTAESKP